MEQIILSFLEKYKGNWEDVYSAVSKKESPDKSFDFSQLPIGMNRCFIATQKYHDKFKDIIMPPFFSFWKGDIKLLDTNVLGFSSSLSLEDYDLLISKYELLNKHTLCFKVNDISKDRLTSLISKGYKIILICEGGFNNLELDSELETNQLLLISEFWDTNSYKPADGQTLERIVFAVSDALYISSSLSIIEKILFNYQYKAKKIYCNDNYKDDLTKFLSYGPKIIYVKNLNGVI